jgi:hypothetical protein
MESINIQLGDKQIVLEMGHFLMLLHDNVHNDILDITNNKFTPKVVFINVLCDYKGNPSKCFTPAQLLEIKSKEKFVSSHETILLLIKQHLGKNSFFLVSTSALDYQSCYFLIKGLRAIQLNTPNVGFLILTTYEVYHRLFQTKTIEVINMDDVMSQLKNLHFFEVKK